MSVATLTTVIPRPSRSIEPLSYFPSIYLTPPPEPETAELLARLATAEPHSHPWRALRARLVQRHMPLVKSIARRFKGRGEDFDDLVQVATMGLLKAMDRFDPTKGAEFTTFATPTMTGELQRHLRDKSTTLRLPRRLQELRAAAGRLSAELHQRLGRTPALAELAGTLGSSVEAVAEALESDRFCVVPLDDTDQASDEQALESVELRATLRPLIGRLPAREKRMVALRFFEHRTQSEIATELGISQVQVSRLLTRTLSNLRQELTETS